MLLRPYERIKKYISDSGLKQCAVADRAGYTARNFSLMMTGKKMINLDDLERICKALNVPASKFILPGGNEKEECVASDRPKEERDTA